MPLQGEDAPPDPREWVQEQVETWERSGGTEGTTLLDTGLPVVIIVNRGAKSGLLHKTPLMRVEHDGRYLMVGSRGGSPKNPGWVHNVRADPHVEVWDGTERGDYTARELEGESEEYETWWRRAADAFSQYDEYRAKAGRIIPLFLLEAAPDA